MNSNYKYKEGENIYIPNITTYKNTPFCQIKVEYLDVVATVFNRHRFYEDGREHTTYELCFGDMRDDTNLGKIFVSEEWIDSQLTTKEIGHYILKKNSNSMINTIYTWCKDKDKYFSKRLFELTEKSMENYNSDFGRFLTCYKKYLNLKQYKELTFKDSDLSDLMEV